MTTPFTNSIVGAQGTLVRSQIKSPNFNLATQQGWAILKNGSAYFFNVTASGTITATTFLGTDFVIDSAGARFYSGTPALNDLNVAIATAPGTDSFTNPYLAGVGAYQTSGNPAVIQLYALLTAGQIQLGGAAPSAFSIIPTIASSNATATSILINSGSTPSGPNSGGIATLFLTTGATGGAKGYVLMSNQCTLLIAGAGPPQTVAALEMNGVNGTGVAISAAGGSGLAPAAVGGFAFLWADSAGAMHSSAPTVLDSGELVLVDVAGAPASVAGQVQLYADTFTQLHTDRAIQGDVSLELKNLGGSPGAGGSGAKQWSSSGHLQVQSGQTGIGGDANNYDAEQLTISLRADTASLTNTVDAVITDGTITLQKAVVASRYRITAVIPVKQGAAAGTITVSCHGPAVSSGGMGGAAVDNANVNNVAWVSGGLGTAAIVQTNIGRTTIFRLDGVVAFSAAGTVSVQSHTSAAADPYLVQAGAFLEVQPVVAT